MTETREFWLAVRQALLMVLDALERMLDISPRTAELRHDKKLLRRNDYNAIISE
jgi:hypothetical protein